MGQKSSVTPVGDQNNQGNQESNTQTSAGSTSEPASAGLGGEPSLEGLESVLNESMEKWESQIRELQEKSGKLITTLQLLTHMDANPKGHKNGLQTTSIDMLMDHLVAQLHTMEQDFNQNSSDTNKNSENRTLWFQKVQDSIRALKKQIN